MRLDHQLCYAALQSRDSRFDGRFFTGVLSTGIYCRPICPAVTPRPENVQFFPSAAAAEEAGLRPCLRCRPESSPGTPEWDGPSGVVSRGLRLISEGALDEDGIDGLTRRLHIGSRQLRRLFRRHLGAPPLAVGLSRRIGFAKKLIDETRLPMTDIAYSSGFSSLRRFNAAMRKAYGRPPTQLRGAGKGNSRKGEDFKLQLKLTYRSPFNWPELLRFLERRAIPGVEAIVEGTWQRTIRAGDHTGIIEVRHEPGKEYLLLSLPPSLSKGLIRTTERIRRLFDFKAAPTQITAVLEKDPLMAPLLRRYEGLRVPGSWDSFELAVSAVAGQRISVKAARTLCGRIAEAYGEPLSEGGSRGLRLVFPNPDRLAEAELESLGLTPKRAKAIRALAKAVGAGRMQWGTASSLEEAIDLLTSLPGIGSWTAHYIALRGLGEPDAFPVGDLGLLRAAALAGRKPLSSAQLLQHAENWRPWRSYAALYLWTCYADTQKELKEREKR